MFERLAGLENEYAIGTECQFARPSNATLVQRVLQGLKGITKTLPGSSKERIFVENGGSFYHDAPPEAPDQGTLEGNTPECRSPRQLLLYQRAQEFLLQQALRRADQPGSVITLFKNCRDAFGNVYGTHENFEVDVAQGVWLWLYRLGLVLVLPFVALYVLVCWLMIALLVALFLVVVVVYLLYMLLSWAIPPLRWERLSRLLSPESGVDTLIVKMLFPVVWVGFATVRFSLFALFWAVGFLQIRRSATAFLVSRSVISGAGTLEKDGSFLLSERASSVKNLLRWSSSDKKHSVYDLRNFFKLLEMPVELNWKGFFTIFRKRQRLQLDLTDANRCQSAEFLKIGATMLVFDMVEAGFLQDAPRLTAPIQALHNFIKDPSLRVKATLKDGTSMTAVEIQRWYMSRAKEFLKKSPTAPMEAYQVVRLWEESLSLLEKNPSALVGTLDWVTKQTLLQKSGLPLTSAACKKIDIKYHQLGDGYFDRLENAGLAPMIVSLEEIERATLEPPSDTPAAPRGEFIKAHSSSEKVVVHWDKIKVGGVLRGKVIPLAKRPKKPEPTEE